MSDDEWEKLKAWADENFAEVISDKTHPIAQAIESTVIYERIYSDQPKF